VIEKRRKGEVFQVDIPAEKWFYIVKKTHDSKVVKK
jgi:hypothetical protein